MVSVVLLAETARAGREAVVRQWERLRETWDADALEAINDLIDAADRVVVRCIWRGAGGHGPPMNMEVTGVYTLRWGRMVAIELSGIPPKPAKA